MVEFENTIHGRGYVRINEASDGVRAEILGLYLTPEVLRKGLGFKLARLMINKAREPGAQSIILDSTITAHAFYQRLGFADTGPLEASGALMVRGFPMILHL